MVQNHGRNEFYPLPPFNQGVYLKYPSFLDLSCAWLASPHKRHSREQIQNFGEDTVEVLDYETDEV